MRWRKWLGLLGSLTLSTTRGAWGEEPLALPPVTAPLPADDARPEAPEHRDASGSTTVITVADHRGEAKDTAELVATAPGVLVKDVGGLGQSKSVLLRGASSNGTLVLLDGIPLTGAGGITDVSLVPLQILDRVEVLRGGAGARYGSGGLGGVINLATRSPRDGAHATADLTYGSFQTLTGELSATGALLGGEGLLLVHGLKTEGDYVYAFNPATEFPNSPILLVRRENNDATQGGALLKYRALLGEWTANVIGETSVLSRGIAGTEYNPTVDEREADARIAAGIRLSRTFEGGAELATRAFAKWDHSDFHGGPFIQDLNQHLFTSGAAVEGSTLIGTRQVVSALVELGYEALQTQLAAPHWFKASAMATDEIQLFQGRLELSPSVRVDQTGPFTTFSPKVGATALLPRGFQIRANAGQAHRAPSFLELYVAQGDLAFNPTLVPERALYADVSLAHRTAWSWISAGAFDSLYENLITYEYHPPFPSKARNIASAEVRGLEVEAAITPNAWISVSAAYTLMFSADLLDAPQYYGKELPYRPRNKWVARVAGGPIWARGHLELDAQSKQFINTSNVGPLPPRAIFNIGISSQILPMPQVTVSLEAKNVTNAQSQEFTGYPLPTRAFYVTASLALDSDSRNPKLLTER